MKKSEAIVTLIIVGLIFCAVLGVISLLNPDMFWNILRGLGVLAGIGLALLLLKWRLEHQKATLPHTVAQKQIASDQADAQRQHERELARLAFDQARLESEHARAMIEAQLQARKLDLLGDQFQLDRHLKMTRIETHEGSATHLLDQGGEIIMLASPDRRQIAGPAAGNQPATQPAALVVPTAPHFRDMWHLLRADRLILCYVWDEQRQVSTPLYGSVDDLLSMIITGKPGRGKTTALMYYIAILMMAGAEVVIFDPHGTMGELAAIPGVVYLDRKDAILRHVPLLQQELAARDELYRPARQTKHPLLLLADELPLLAEYDDDLAKECKRDKENGHETYLAYSPNRIIRRFVLEARKWRCYFIGSGQSIDADVLPRKTTDSINSRIVFFSSDLRARMAGLEGEAVKRLLPLIRRAESGSMIFDLARADEPVLGALPNIDVESMLAFLEHIGAHRGTSGNRDTDAFAALPDVPTNVSQFEGRRQGKMIIKEAQGTVGVPPMEPLPRLAPESPATVPASPVAGFIAEDGDMLFDLSQEAEFLKRYRGAQNIKVVLRQMGLSNRYNRHASFLVSSRNLRRA